MVLIIAPIYNAAGTRIRADNADASTSDGGPGQRPNAQGFDLIAIT